MAVRTTTTATEPTEEVQTVENTVDTEIIHVIYIGPTLPAGQLKCNKVLCGTAAEIKKELQPVIEKYPLVEKMLVPVTELAAKKDKVKTAGNILNKYYSDIVSAAAAETKEV